jgi:hypothetical protein
MQRMYLEAPIKNNFERVLFIIYNKHLQSELQEICFEVNENKEGELKIGYKRIRINEELKEQEGS